MRDFLRYILAYTKNTRTIRLVKDYMTHPIHEGIALRNSGLRDRILANLK